MLTRVKKLLVPFFVVIASVLIARAMLSSKEELQTRKDEAPLPVVKTLAVTMTDVPVAIVAHGNARAKHELELASEVTGRVVWVAENFEPGERVRAGEVLLRIDSINYRVALAEAQVALESADTALADAIALKRKAAQSEAKLNIEAAHLRILKAEQDLSYTEIRAPFNAVIDRQMVELSQFINTGQTVARLLSSDTAEITLPLPASDAGFLSSEPGTQVSLFARMGAQQRQWQGRVLRVESRVDSETRVIPVVVEVASPYDVGIHTHALTLGLFVEVQIPGKPISSAVRLPGSALHPGESVFVLSGDSIQRRAVQIAYRQGDSVVVSGGLVDGDIVVITALDVMFEGMKVSGAQ